MKDVTKKFYTIGCCGIDCGLCPRYYTNGSSACTGCGGLNFKDKHPSCGYLSCCVIKNGHEVCSDCKDYPCKRFDSEKNGYDSFVTHKMVFKNLDFLKDQGINNFIEIQKQRIDILKYFIDNFDDGRSKNYFCLCCTILPLEKLVEASEFIQNMQKNELTTKELNTILKNRLHLIANNLNIELKLNKKK